MPGPKNANIKKVGLQMKELKDKLPQFKELDQRNPLKSFIKEVCHFWDIAETENYALYSDDWQAYITETNRVNINDGHVLTLASSPIRNAQRIAGGLKSNKQSELVRSLENLSEMSSDITFAKEFFQLDGFSQVISGVESCTFSGECLGYGLASLVELMDHGLLPWDTLSPTFVNKVAVVVNTYDSKDNKKALAVQSALSLLESIASESADMLPTVESEVKIGECIRHLHSSDQKVQLKALSLINALFTRAPSEKKKEVASLLNSRSLRNVIQSNIIHTKKVNMEMAQQLHILQMTHLNLLDVSMMTGINPNDSVEKEKVNELRRIVFDPETENVNTGTLKKPESLKKDFKKLGFEDVNNPCQDFVKVPPGEYALDLMLYFAQNHSAKYSRVVRENSRLGDDHACPFVKASVELINLLRVIFQIGEPPSAAGGKYYQIFFSHDHPFEEFFCISIQLLNKTWKEMRATVEDFHKVLTVVREQITRALQINPPTVDSLQKKLNELTYSEINSQLHQEYINMELNVSQCQPIIELKEKIMPEILDLVKQRRVAGLVDGMIFVKTDARGRPKGKSWCCRLSANHKTFHYDDISEVEIPPAESLKCKLDVADIKDIITDFSHAKDQKKQDKEQRRKQGYYTFKIVAENECDSLVFQMVDENMYNVWVDGLNALLGRELTSPLSKSDLDCLLNMDIKLRLLDTEGLIIPKETPPVPPPPDNFDFSL